MHDLLVDLVFNLLQIKLYWQILRKLSQNFENEFVLAQLRFFIKELANL